MKWLYLLLDGFTLLCPLVLSFEKKVHFYRSWKSAILASLIVAIPFLIWDFYFTEKGFWGFNPEYISGIYLFHLPLEEYLFFIVVPVACTFIYEVCKYFFRNYELRLFNRIFQFAIPAYALLLVLIGDIGYYTLSVEITAALVLAWMMLNPAYKYTGLAFVFSLLPFFLVNGILTGSFIPGEVVWYSEAQKVEPRLFTIPMEDILYSFSLVVPNMLLFEKIKARLGA